VTKTQVNVGLIRFVALLLLFITAIPFFIAVNLSIFDSGWTDLSAVVGYLFTAFGIYTAMRYATDWVRAQ